MIKGKKCNNKKIKKNLKKIKNKFKGFTLVELLAVIVILAIIMIIAIPSVLTTLTAAKKKTFDEYITKVYTSTEKEHLEGQLLGTSKSCVMYDIGDDIGLSTTGNYKGYTLVVKTNDNTNTYNYYITMWDDEYMVYGLKYGNSYEFEQFTDESDSKLSKENLAAVGGCETYVDHTNGTSGSASNIGLGIDQSLPDTNFPSDTTQNTTSKNEPLSFDDDDWSTIKENISSDAYKIGDTKCVKINGLKGSSSFGCKGGFPVRIANKTSCSDEQSQSACGIVLEFSVGIMNRGLNVDRVNEKGWAGTTIRTYLNNDFYNALPDDLKSIIIDTRIVSGHGDYDTESITTYDKIYLLSTEETFGPTYHNNMETDSGTSRQLDYYRDNGVTASNTEALHKDGCYAGVWWLRTPFIYLKGNGFFRAIAISGVVNYAQSQSTYTISPAFRIG